MDNSQTPSDYKTYFFDKFVNLFQSFVNLSLEKVDNLTLNFLAECNSALEIGLISLKKSQAKILSQNKSALVLGKLNKISDLAAKELSFYQGNILELPALNQLSPKAFAYLNEFKGDFLTIGSLKKNHFNLWWWLVFIIQIRI